MGLPVNGSTALSVASSWLGLYAPKGLPPAILAKLREAVAKTLEDPAVQKRFEDLGGVVPPPADRGGARRPL